MSHRMIIELLWVVQRANLSLIRLPTVEKNSYVHWLGSCISFTSTSSNNDSKSTKIPDYNIANFDVLKLPVLEVRFYTPRRGDVTSVPDANTDMKCFSCSHRQ